MNTKLFYAAALIAAVTFTLYACSKSYSEQKKLEVYLTDAPTNLSEVNVDLKEVQVKLEKGGWTTLQITPRIINLLSLQGGTTTQVAGGTFTSTENVQEIRLILGPNNSVKEVNGGTFSLTIPSGSESGLKIKVGKRLRASLEKIIIDFDAAESVRQDPSGYKLRPVLKLK